MLEDRDYMRSGKSGRQSLFEQWPGWAVIMGLTCAFFVLQILTSNFGGGYYFALFRPWEWEGSLLVNLFWGVVGCVGYIFRHSDGSHLVWNMIFLFFFGRFLEDLLGKRDFLRLYFFSGIGAGLIWIVLSSWLEPARMAVGASAALFGIFTAAAIMEPDVVVHVFFIIPVKLKWVALFSVLISLFLLGDPYTHISYLLHLSGALCGAVAVLRFHPGRVQWSLLRRFVGRPKSGKRIIRFPGGANRNTTSSAAASQESVDQILDKIAREGLQSLTPKERQILENARKRLRDN
ncbi:MAG: rhomboid family intramembrane serine protease [Lentisphaerae bacterium]|nr:MAG: rhomboid family intramembrane serine protease [Lentisphaerota bacterium]